MNLISVTDALNIASMIAIQYFVIGQNFIRFYFEDRAKILEKATKTNEICHTNNYVQYLLKIGVLNLNRDTLCKGACFTILHLDGKL